MDGVLDDAGSHREIDYVHRLVVIHIGIDQSAGKGIPAAYTVQNVEGELLALKGVAIVPHKGLQAVFTAGMGRADVAGNAFQIGIQKKW